MEIVITQCALFDIHTVGAINKQLGIPTDFLQNSKKHHSMYSLKEYNQSSETWCQLYMYMFKIKKKN